MEERAIAVAPAIYRGESGHVRSTSNATLFAIGWESPTFRTNIVGSIRSISITTVSTSRCGTEVIPVTISAITGIMYSAISMRAA